MPIVLECRDYKENTGSLKYNIALYDPPFDMWHQVDFIVPSYTYVCFTNFKNKHHVENLFGKPRVEIIWFFEDGRWVNHKLPRQTHEYIMIYGEIKNECYVGERNDLKEMKKGKGSIGRDKDLGNRIYKPRGQKMMNSVIAMPRNVSKELGVWSKPEQLIKMLMMWLCDKGDLVWDGFAGSGTVAVVSDELGLAYYGCEINETTHKKAIRRVSYKQQQKHLF